MKLILIIVCLGSLPAWAGPSALEGHLELRPSWSAARRTFHSENEIGLQLALPEAKLVGYVQEFGTHLAGTEAAFTLRDGYFKAQWDRLSQDGRFGGEVRAYLPTSPEERRAGFNGALRAIGKVSWEINSILSFEIWESPMLPWYSQAGYETTDGATANRTFDNRLEFIPRLTLGSDRVTLRLPLVYQAIHLREFRSPATWRHLLWINPEVLVAVAEKTFVGVSYYSESFIGEKASLEQGLLSGTAQLVFHQRL